jgi:hypothetical protein
MSRKLEKNRFYKYNHNSTISESIKAKQSGGSEYTGLFLIYFDNSGIFAMYFMASENWVLKFAALSTHT